MPFAVICTDKKGALETRMANRDAHLDHVARTGIVLQAGPFLDDAGQMCGSLILFDTEDRATAEAWAEADPYAASGLFERVEIRHWKKVVG